MTFNPGDIVRLKSGGPAMTVVEVRMRANDPRAVTCIWFAGDACKQDQFFAHTLAAQKPIMQEPFVPSEPGYYWAIFKDTGRVEIVQLRTAGARMEALRLGSEWITPIGLFRNWSQKIEEPLNGD